ncbi:MAG: alpha/beta hydrolase [Rubrivivax sp.]|nr:alpha/beta hydrolase [Rubrivivax sp.]
MLKTPQWYDQQYNARAGIPDAAEHLQRWASRSAAARAQLRSVLDVPYTEAGHHNPGERLDIFLPSAPSAGSPAAPVLIHIHGGYWRALDKQDQSFIAQPFCEAGALVLVPNYNLCPQVTLAQIVMQMVQAVAWAWAHAAEYGGDPHRIVVTGHSAGGHLAAMMMACEWPQVAPGLPADVVKVAVPVSGLFELEPLRHAPFLSSDLGLTAAEAERLSPALLPLKRPRAGSVQAFVGEQESPEFHRQGRALREAWGLRVVSACEAVPGCHHLSVMDALVDPSTRLHQAVRRALGV